MRLLRVSAVRQGLVDEVGVAHGEVSLYADPSTGQVYALDDDERDELDPLWRDDTPESA